MEVAMTEAVLVNNKSVIEYKNVHCGPQSRLEAFQMFLLVLSCSQTLICSALRLS